ncbi:MAG: hypothetical protein V2I33_11465 [Kangiellaceae bacterium]|nr:hypothetical protein [Kangiellaceae bacterium]
MTFSNAGNFQAPRALFIAGWKVWFKRFTDDHDAWREGKMPLHNHHMTMHEMLQKNHRFSVEVLSRLMVPWSYRDQQQVTDDFIRLNPGVIRGVGYVCERTGHNIDGARLTDQALDYWDSLAYIEQDLYLNFAEARIQSDIESPSDEPCIIDDAGVELIGEDIYPPVVPSADASDKEFIRAMVAWIDDDPFTPMYRRHAVAEAVSSWHDRLLAFFWPKPRTGYMEFSHAVSPLLYRVTELAGKVQKGEEWSYADKSVAVKSANEVFMLAGVPQREVTWQNVFKVFKSAISQVEQEQAKMNSGWTSLAAMATSQLKGCQSLISWNSRISSSVISRLDFLLVESGITQLGERFKHLGTIPGWGGTRPREYTLNWPSAYRSWQGQFAAAELANEIVDCLNNEKTSSGEPKYRPMPLPGGKTAPWDVRGVQLVLFSDGY